MYNDVWNNPLDGADCADASGDCEFADCTSIATGPCECCVCLGGECVDNCFF